jgi:hypothetical protein
MTSAVTKFSGCIKHATASWRDLMTGMESVGRRSQVRSRERPSVVFVLFNVPGRILVRR